MLNPQAGVLVFVETGHQCLLQFVHQPRLFRLCNVGLLKGQYAGSVGARNVRKTALSGSVFSQTELTQPFSQMGSVTPVYQTLML